MVQIHHVPPIKDNRMQKLHIGNRVERLFVGSGLSKKEFCKRLGIDRKTLRDVISRFMRVTVNVAMRLEAAGLCNAKTVLQQQLELDLLNFDLDSVKEVKKIELYDTVIRQDMYII